MLAIAAKLVRQPLPTMASLPDSFFFGVALVASSQAEKSWSVGLGQQKDIRKLEFYVIRHEFSE
jgi:hypothetical protein